MDEKPPSKTSDGAASEERRNRKQDVPERPVKPRVLKVGLYGLGAGVCAVAAGYLISADHSFLLLSDIFLLGFFVFTAFVVRLTLINHKWTIRRANTGWLLIVTIGLAVCATIPIWDARKKK